MLSNNADAFFTTPMPTTITTQAREATARATMPSPRPLSQSATATAAVPAFLPGLGSYVNAPAYAGVQGYLDAGYLDRCYLNMESAATQADAAPAPVMAQ